MMVKLILILVSSTILLASCSNSEVKDLSDKVERTQVKSSKDLPYPQEYDQGIMSVCNLFDAKSLNEQIFEDYEKFLTQSDELFIVNETSYCMLHIANGGAKGEFQTITVGYISDLPNDLKSNRIFYKENFKTNNGITLGISLEEFYSSIPKKVKLEKIKEGNITTIRVNDSFHVYSASYIFFENRLTSFNFGYSEN